MTRKLSGFARRLLWAVVETVWFAIVLIALFIWIAPDLFRRRRK